MKKVLGFLPARHGIVGNLFSFVVGTFIVAMLLLMVVPLGLIILRTSLT
jgi:hypothetical protein